MTENEMESGAETKALIVVDMQNGFLKPDGFMVKAGLNIDQCAAADRTEPEGHRRMPRGEYPGDLHPLLAAVRL